MTRTLVGNAECWGQGWRAQAEGSSQAGWSPKGRAYFPQNFLPGQIPDHLFPSSPPFTPRLWLPSAFVVPILEVPCGLYPLKSEIFLAHIGRSRPEASSRPDSVTDPRLKHAP